MMKLECTSTVPGQAKKISTRYLVPGQARYCTGIDTSWDLAVFLASDPECTNLASSTVPFTVYFLTTRVPFPGTRSRSRLRRLQGDSLINRCLVLCFRY